VHRHEEVELTDTEQTSMEISSRDRRLKREYAFILEKPSFSNAADGGAGEESNKHVGNFLCQLAPRKRRNRADSTDPEIFDRDPPHAATTEGQKTKGRENQPDEISESEILQNSESNDSPVKKSRSQKKAERLAKEKAEMKVLKEDVC
jgi:hypothetical protein